MNETPLLALTWESPLTDPTTFSPKISRSVRPDGNIIIFIQSLAIGNNDNLPSSIRMPKKVQKFAKKPSKNLPKDF